MKNKEPSKLNNFLEKNFKVVLGIVLVLFVFLIVGVVASSINAKSVEKSLSEIDQIDYIFRKDSAELNENDFTARQNDALENLESLSSKSGIVGVRANMFKADILFQKNDFEASREAWLKAADSKKSAYTSAICFYNAAVCSENLNDLQGAIDNYSKAINAKEFYLIDHAYFNLGRVNEEIGNFDKAKEAYEKLNELHPNSPWAPVAKSRIISINSSNNQ